MNISRLITLLTKENMNINSAFREDKFETQIRDGRHILRIRT